MTTKTASDLKTRRVEAGITRKVAAEAAGISQFKLDKIERGVDVGDDERKAYDDGLAKLLAQATKTSTTNGKARTSTAKKTTARTRKAAQPKAKTEESAA
jgi:DNA-binding XRE family transcriptional regulator